jgi:YcaO-like protein with predicted kinase domain
MISHNLMTSVRCRKASETLALLEAHIEDLQVTGVIDITLPELDEIPIYQVFRKNHRSGYFNYGKGFDHTVSKVSALMEALEMAVMEYPDSDISVNVWCGMVDPENIRRANNSHSAKNLAMQDISLGRFNQGVDLINGQIFAVPNEDLFFNCENKCLETQPSTNGLASGNTLEEATISAIHELVERHLVAQSMWGVEVYSLASLFAIDCPLKMAIQKMLAQQMTYKIFFLGALAGVFVFRSEVTFPIDGQEEFGTSPGWGAHSDPIIAVNRSVAEAIQIISSYRAIRNGLTPVTEIRDGLAVSAETQRLLGSPNQFRLMNRVKSIQERQSRSKNSKSLVWDKIMQLKEEIPDETDLDSLIDRLRKSGVRELVSVRLSAERLPFTVVRCFNNDFKAPW